MDIRSITKEKLIKWLEAACYLLDTCAIPLIDKAAKKVSKIKQLLEEKMDEVNYRSTAEVVEAEGGATCLDYSLY